MNGITFSPANKIGDPFSLNPVIRRPAVITTTLQMRLPDVTTRNLARAVPMRLADRPGQVIQLQIDPQFPDAHGIVAQLNYWSEQWGRDPRIRQFVERYVLPGQMGDNDVRRHISAATEFVKQRVRYTADPDGAEYVQTPLRMLTAIEQDGYVLGDCDDHVLLLNAILGSLGIRTRVIGVKLNSASRFDHVISSTWNGFQWIDIDPCAKSTLTPQYRERLV